MTRIKQKPGKKYTFKTCKHSGILPIKEGTGSPFALWASGRWVCRKCHMRKITTMRRTPLGWARTLLYQAKARCRKLGYKAPDISPEKLMGLILQNPNCAFCGGPLLTFKELLVKKNKRKVHLHHNHETGGDTALTHWYCNVAEGNFLVIDSIERKEQFLNSVCPELVEFIFAKGVDTGWNEKYERQIHQ
jgi:hypothetical protein